ncbi:Ca2+-binding protein, RTX toxin-related [Cognatiyoonia koreensis]|uniref:Ca2+-binding protein, RTX toxin-related n=1 Tax=Cognatiyoonia koreensis TaxID=364200 RepID=A0A1I0P7J3_9RHOB|nr:Hint domain-containing protein [Cognatiyoonia koreensis]SEW10355.1 Ca2+-binding protein, RTX toxin-related [Cognatiyoonia koreensis]
MTKTIDFNNLGRGTVVDNEYTSQGVTISAFGGSNKAMIFDTANPTGGDHDLATNNLGNVLIISEDGDSHDPDDNAGGGKLRFDFHEAADVKSLTFLDIEEGAVVRFYDENNCLIATRQVGPTANNGQLVAHFDVDGVYRMDVQLCGSGAIDNLVFDDSSDLDGIVEGSTAGERIDANYTGDPDGDRVDANDQILAGEGVNDDIIMAEDGDDFVLAGNGDDEVYGGGGDDTLCGQDGNDELHGDSGDDILEGMNGDDLLFGGLGDDRVYGDAGDDTAFGGAGNDIIRGGTGDDLLYGDTGGNNTIRESLDWDLAGSGNGQDLNGFTQNTGNVDVTFTILKEKGSDTEFESDDQLVSGIDDDGRPVDDNSSLYSVTDGNGNSADYRLDFSDPVENVSFRINDIDGDGVVRVKAFDAHGNAIAINLVAGSCLTLSNTDGVPGNDTASSNGGYAPDTSPHYSVLVSIPGPVARIEIEHDQDGGANSGINVTDIYFDVDISGSGDDDIDGGAGNDTIFGEDGDDVLAGGTGDDVVRGGDGNDVLDGGSGNDMLFGGSGNDTITGGAGNDKLEGSGGDDVLDGGDGDDDIWGGRGQDVITTGAGADTVDAGADADTIFGSAGDTIDGGAAGDDNDVLDLTGQGPYILAGPDGTGSPVPDSNGNGFDGTVVFVDEDGNPTGETISFTEIESIVGDEVNRGPVANDDDFGAGEDDPAGIIGNVLTNDSDPDGDDLTVGAVNGDPAGVGTPVAGSNGGLVTINPDGTVAFDPNGEFESLGEGETVETTVTYTVDDGNGGTTTATVTITVTGTNDDPIAVADTDSTDQDTAIALDNVLGNDTDPEGDDLTVSAVNGAGGNVGAPVAGDNGGLLTIGADGTASFDPNGDFDDLAAGETAETTVAYTISDGNGGEDTTTVTITVTGSNDGPTAVADTFAGDEDNVEVVGNVLDNDEDPDSDPLTVGAVNGNPANVGAPVPANGGGLVTIAQDGTVTFDPNGEFDELAPGETAEVTVEYTVTDPSGATSTETVTITVNGINDGPVATDNTYTFDPTEAAGDVDGNVITDDTGNGSDSDPENDNLSVSAVGGAAAGVGAAVAGDNGGLFTIGADGTVDFDANGEFDDLGLGESASTSVTYTIVDENGAEDTATVTFTVDGVNNGTVEGTDGDDVILPGYVDADGDIVDGEDNILPGKEPNDDVIVAGAGDDSVVAGLGDDTVFGGTGNDTIDGGEGDDVLDGGTGDDSITGGTGGDFIEGGDGDDVINAGNHDDPLPDVGYPQQGLFPGYDADPDPTNDLDTVFGGAGNDTISTGDDNDTIFGGSGDDTIDAGIDDDSVDGGTGNDTIIGSEGNDIIDGGEGDDLIFGGLDLSVPDFVNIPDDEPNEFGFTDLVTDNNNDTLFGGAGNDTIYGQDDDDTLFGGTGKDTLFGGVDDDELIGGDGDDTLFGGQGNDDLEGGAGEDVLEGGAGADFASGGLGSDTFIGGNGGDVVVGGEDPDGSDIDVLDLTGSAVDFITYDPNDPEAGVVTFLDGSTMTFSEIENVIPCFTPGTTIATPKGERLVEELQVGDRIITRDNGIQEIAWVGHKTMDGKQLAANPHLKPILIKAGSLGDGLPERDMLVSPNHRVLVASEMTQLYFEEREVLAAVKHMTGAQGIHAVEVMATTYIHFMFERHEVVLSNGAWTESFQPGDYSLKGIGNSQRNEIFELFPELATKTGLEDYQSARKALKKHEAKLLMK